MNNEMNNLNMTMTAMKESRGEGNYSALKTLTNVYNSMLNKFVNLGYNDLSEYSIGEKLEKNLYEVKKIESHLSEVSYPNSIDNCNYKDSHKIQYIIEELDKVILKLEILVEKYRRMRDVNNIMKSDVAILKSGKIQRNLKIRKNY